MENQGQLEEATKREIFKLRNLGEHGRKGSDHLSFRSLLKFSINKIKKVKKKGKLIYKVICTYEIYTETEFLHTPDMDDFYTEHYKDIFIFDTNYNLLDIQEEYKHK
ncbi:MAG: hypothetical protein ACFE9R_16030 [Candidatus Hermodarchaeota archaeon]